MSVYNKIIVAVDLSNDTRAIVTKALQLVDNDVSKISLVHVVEPIATAYTMDAYAINVNELQQQAMDVSKENLAKAAILANVSGAKQHTLLGTPASEIRNLASELNADAIVIGSHGRSGWKVLLGSTADKVLHGASCDVLTVLVGK